MSVLWYVCRATGEATLLFLSVVVTLGVMSAARFGGRRVPRFVIADVHRNLTLVGLGFLAVHVAATVADSYVPITVADVVVPFGSAYRPVWLGLGTLAFDLLVALTVTSLLRLRIGVRRWKALHWSAYGCWILALVHALGTGSDTRSSLFLMLAGLCCALVLAAVGRRLVGAGPDHPARRSGAGLAILMVVGVIVVWTVYGPLASDWAERSGTPHHTAGSPSAGSGAVEPGAVR